MMDKLRKAIPFLAIFATMALGMRIDIMDIDAAQYASISAEILRTGNWLSPTNDHNIYLDKPPLHFWMSATSMALMGIGNVGYKLPALLMALLTMFATYRIGLLIGTEQTGRNAAMVLGSMLALMLMTNDVRTDTALLGSTTTAVWLWTEVLLGAGWRHLIGAAVFTGMAMLAKGPIGAVFPFFALGPFAIITRKNIRLKLMMTPLALGVIALLLLPMCIGLWRDHGPEGLRFYFWTQSFGRITGENRWHNDSTFFYLSHALLWATAPWTIMAAAGLLRGLRSIPDQIRGNPIALVPISATLLGYTSVSLSHYKLPHYIFIILPYIALLVAREVDEERAWHRWVMRIACGVLVVAAWVLCLWAFSNGAALWLAVSAGIICTVPLVQIGGFTTRLDLVEGSVIMACAAFVCLNGQLYPELLRYQANSQVGQWAKANNVRPGELISFGTGGHSLNFYAGGTVPWYARVQAIEPSIRPGICVVADSTHSAELMAAGFIPKEKIAFPSFRVQMLTWKFVNPATRKQSLRTSYVLRY